MKNNNKGFTVVELLASFTLTMVIVVLLFEILIELKNFYYEAGVKTKLIHSKSILVDKIRDTLDSNELAGITCSGRTCKFLFMDNESMNLTIDRDKNTISFGDEKVKFPNDVDFSNYSLKTCAVAGDKPTNDLGMVEDPYIKNCYVALNVDIENTRLKKNYPINIVYPFVYNPDFLVGNFESENSMAGTKQTFTCKGNTQEYVAPANGNYKIQILGASGGASSDSSIKGGDGAYAEGEIYLEKDEKLSVNVGCKGNEEKNGVITSTGGYNGGGNGVDAETGTIKAGGGGGATDIRFGGNQLNDRIMVAAGGSGAGNGKNAKAGMPGGSLIANNSSHENGPKGATQTTGGTKNVGKFGQGADAILGGGGGGGYYGGAGGINVDGDGTSGTGGSSYISGYLGVNSVIASSNEQIHTNDNVHYSGKVFYNSILTSGDKVSSDYSSETFHSSLPEGIAKSGDGYAIITYVGSDLPEEVSSLASVNAGYDMGNLSLWFDGYDNDGTGIHNYKTNDWMNLATGIKINLTDGKWYEKGLSLKSKANAMVNLTSEFTLSTVFSLENYPDSKKFIIGGNVGLFVTDAGNVGYSNGTTEVVFDYKISALNVKEYLTVVGSSGKVTLYKYDKENIEEVSSKMIDLGTDGNRTLNISGELDGILNKVMIYSSAFDLGEIKEMNDIDYRRFNPIYKSLSNQALEYSFDESANYDSDDKVVFDISGNGKESSVEGEMTIVNKGLTLNGSDSNFIKMAGTVNYRYSLILVASSSELSGTPILVGSGTYPTLKLSSDGYKYQIGSNIYNHSFKTNKKQFIAVVYDGKNITLYLDGNKVESKSYTEDPMSVETAYIGKNFKGSIYKYALYDRNLSDAEIKYLYEYDYNNFK